MIRRWRERTPIFYCIGAEVLFLLIMMIGVYGLAIGLMVSGVDLLSIDEYALTLIQELFGIAVGVLLLLWTGRKSLLTRRGCGFLDGLLVGMYPFALISYSLVVNLTLLRPDGAMRSPIQILIFVAAMFSVGVAEEIVFRGVIAETLLEKFGPSTLGTWQACLVSGIFFGAAHLTNLMGSAPLGVLMQCVFTMSLGVMLTAIYFRTGNLWVPIFLHGYMDVASMVIGGLYGTQTVSEAVSGYDLSMLTSTLIYILPVFFLLRKKKLPQVWLNFREELGPAGPADAPGEPD